MDVEVEVVVCLCSGRSCRLNSSPNATVLSLKLAAQEELLQAESSRELKESTRVNLYNIQCSAVNRTELEPWFSRAKGCESESESKTYKVSMPFESIRCQEWLGSVHTGYVEYGTFLVCEPSEAPRQQPRVGSGVSLLDLDRWTSLGIGSEPGSRWTDDGRNRNSPKILKEREQQRSWWMHVDGHNVLEVQLLFFRQGRFFGGLRSCRFATLQLFTQFCSPCVGLC